MADSIRLGLIGTSWWMDMAHLPLFRSDPRVEMVAICGRNPANAQAMARKYSIPTIFSDYRQMIADANLDAILISTPDDEHYAMTMAALDTGLHVLCEKPLALNAHDAKAMLDKAEAKGVRHMTFFTYRWLSHYRAMHQMIEQGMLGKILHARFAFSYGSARTNQYEWRFDRKRANGALGDMGAHMFDMTRFLLGDIQRVNAKLATYMTRKDSDGQSFEQANEAANALLELKSGAQVSVQLSAVARVDDPMLAQQIAIHGVEGSIVAETRMGSPMRLLFAKGNDPLQPISIPAEFCKGVDLAQPLITQTGAMLIQPSVAGRLFVDGILEERPIEPSFYDGWKAQQVIDAALASHETGRWVEI